MFKTYQALLIFFHVAMPTLHDCEVEGTVNSLRVNLCKTASRKPTSHVLRILVAM